MEERYKACLMLAAVGDAMGYKNGEWKFERSGELIHAEVKQLGGIENLDLTNWRVTDDTVMTIATGNALFFTRSYIESQDIFSVTAICYIVSMNDMNGRAPDRTCIESLKKIDDKQAVNGYQLPFNPKGAGCGAAMRAVPIGLRFNKKEHLQDLIRFGVECGRITHHHPIGYLGSVTVALFTSYIIQDIPLIEWGRRLLNTMNKIESYVRKSNHEVEKNLVKFEEYFARWSQYLMKRGIYDEQTVVSFLNDTVSDRDEFYKSLSINGIAGSCGHDAPMIAYDALLHSGDNWKSVCERAMLHGGDSDSTGILAGAWYGLLYGIDKVPMKHYYNIEKKDELCVIAKLMYNNFYKE